MLSRLNWNTIEVHFKHLRLQMLHKIIHSSVDVSLPNYIIYRKRYTRSSDLIQLDTAINEYKYSFFPASIRLWNKLPRDVVNCDNIDNFKEHLNHTNL